MVLLLLACAEVVPLDSDTPATTDPSEVDLQLTSDFVDQLAEGYACTSSMVGAVHDEGLLIDALATRRLQVASFGAVVFVGTGLDGFFDDDNCDDLLGGGFSEQRIGMAYSLTAGTIEVHQDQDTRTFRLVDAVFTPDPQYDLDACFADAADYQPVEIGTVTLPPLPLGGTAAELR